jgi:hypothetical protein
MRHNLLIHEKTRALSGLCQEHNDAAMHGDGPEGC